MNSQVVQKNGLYELEAAEDVRDSQVFNEDIAPTKISMRTWNKWHVAALWVGMAICVPTYTLGGVLTSFFGLSISEALITILFANIIVLVPLILNAFPGTKFGIPFPVLLRSSFGIYGSNIPAIIRAFVACGWFGIQTMFGGIAIHKMLSAIFPLWSQLEGIGEVSGFFIFWFMNVYFVIKGSESIKLLEAWSAPLLVIVSAGLLFWAFPKIDFSQLIQIPPNRPAHDSVLPYFFAGLTAMVGFWATLSLNIPDFSRFVKSQKDQIIGQIIGLPLTMLLFSMLGVVLTAASPSLVGEMVSDPITLIGKIHSPFWVALAMFIIIVATISTNTAANMVSPTNDLQNLLPKFINFKRGTIITGIIGIVLMSHELLRKLELIVSDVSIESLYSNWLLGYSSLLGPIAGIMIVDYFIVRKQHIDLVAIYTVSGIYPRFHWAGLISFFIPVVLTITSLITQQFLWLYKYGWFTGSLSGACIYFIASKTMKKEQNVHLIAETVLQ